MIVNFGYVIDNELAGLAHPDTFGDVMGALIELRRLGIQSIVSLDERGLAHAVVKEQGLEYLHLPIPDFNPPEAEQARQFVQFVNEQRTRNHPVAVHCQGGYGRTGTLIACYLISQGYTASQAIDLVRRKRPGSIETAGQEDFLHQFEKTQGTPQS